MASNNSMLTERIVGDAFASMSIHDPIAINAMIQLPVCIKDRSLLSMRKVVRNAMVS